MKRHASYLESEEAFPTNIPRWRASVLAHAEVGRKHDIFQDFEDGAKDIIVLPDTPAELNTEVEVDEASEHSESIPSSMSDSDLDKESIDRDGSGDNGSGDDGNSDDDGNDGGDGKDGGDGNQESITHSPPQLGAATQPTTSLPYHWNSLNSAIYGYNGLFSLEAEHKTDHAIVQALRLEKHKIKKLLDEAKERRRQTEQQVLQAQQSLGALHSQLGISEELWKEYEAFCESLQPKFGQRAGWSVTCFSDHNNCYVDWDPELELFMDTADMSLENCNFRCEAYTIKQEEDTDIEEEDDADSTKAEYEHGLSGSPVIKRPDVQWVVEFWPLRSPEPNTGTETTWGEQFPNLYRLVTIAFYDLTRDNRPVSDLMDSLPDRAASFSGGWLFDYRAEPGLAAHPVVGRRYTYRGAHKINTSGYDWTESEPEDFVVDLSESSQDSYRPKSSEDSGSGSSGGWTGESEDPLSPPGQFFWTKSR